MKKLIVGLGNPGASYKGTRHNIGFKIIELLIGNTGWKSNKKFLGDVYEFENTIYLKPQTFMNRSGSSVKKVADFYKIPSEKICVIHDDADILVGTYKLQKNKSAAGHNGVADIIERLGTQDFWRVRLGISRPPVEEFSIEDWVLKKITEDELRPIVSQLVDLKKDLSDI